MCIHIYIYIYMYTGDPPPRCAPVGGPSDARESGRRKEQQPNNYMHTHVCIYIYICIYIYMCIVIMNT